jgi:fucose 4-O-acetylase-like acetyltransferase
VKRDERIDILKGIAICMVVLGHVIGYIYGTKIYYNNLIFKVCYSFHMPLFIFINGWLDSLKKSSDINNLWLKKKTIRLMVPYILWTLLKWAITRPDRNIFECMFIKPLYWYLINAYLCFIVIYISYVSIKNIMMTSVTVYIISVILMLFCGDNLVIKNFIMFFPFYMIGYYTQINRNRLKIFEGWIKWSLVLYPVSMLFYSYKQYDLYAPYININNKFIKGTLLFYNHYIVAILGIMFSFSLVNSILKYKKLNIVKRYFSTIGKYTMQIYLLHDYFFVNIFKNVYIDGVISFILSLTVSLLISVFIARYKNINKILFGN